MKFESSRPSFGQSAPGSYTNLDGLVLPLGERVKHSCPRMARADF